MIMKTFKKLYAITFIFIVALACSSDDDSGSTEGNQAKLIGTWKFTASTTNGLADTDNYICDFEETYEINATSITITFYADPSGDDGPDCQPDGNFSFDYNIDGDTLSDNEGNTITILTLNDTTFRFEETDTFDGITDIYTQTYTKQ